MKKILLCILLPMSAFAQKDVSFWFAAPEVHQFLVNNSHDRPIYLRLTSFGSPATVTISMPADPSFIPINITLAANSYGTVDLTPFISQIENTTANVVANKGVFIQSTADITVYYEVLSDCQCNPELFALKGKNALGNEFFIPSQTEWPVDSVRFPQARSAFNIVATENNTSVTITPSKHLIGRLPGIPFSVTLNKGQTFSAQALYRAGVSLLNGSTVLSNKPVAVTADDDLLMSDGPCADLAGDQLIPTSIWGNEFVVVKGALTNKDKIVISAMTNGTNIYLNGSTTPAATINRGGSYEINLTSSTSYIKSDKNVSVYHYTGINCEIGSAVVPKLNCTGSTDISVTRSFDQATNVYITTRNGFQSGFAVNGNTSILTASDFQPVPGTAGNFVYCKKDLSGSLPVGSPSRFTNSLGKFQFGILNGDYIPNVFGGCSYGFFSDFKSSSVTRSYLETCKTDSAQLNAFGGVSYQWSPSTGLSNTTIANPKALPAVSTQYKVIITTAEGCIDSAFIDVNVVNCQVLGPPVIINEYTPAISLNSCKNELTVEDASKFQVGDTVLLIQMKGAVIDSTNTAAFGSITNYRNAGNFEFNYVKNKSGNVLTLRNIVTRQFDLPDGKVQLIRVPYFYNYVVDDTLTCLPWDGSKGGVLAFNVRDTLVMNNFIDVTGKGFGGGNSPNPASNTLSCNNNEFAYAAGDLSAAAKGEGITSIGSSISWGKGASANAGGGGLGHNSGGGGGSNSGSGGLGGYQLEACGNAPFDNRGKGGYSLSYSNILNKVFMGGGGGSGHTDNSGGSPMNGGKGGGIVIINSSVIQNNNFKIIANGADAPDCNSSIFSDCHDASGGGGGGGAILIRNGTYISSLLTEANGGKGGDLMIFDNASGRGRIGPGGGGGGGAIWLSAAALPANLTANRNGGLNGVIRADNNNPWGATSGGSGSILFNLVLPVTVNAFTPNIDSVRIKDSITSCNSFDFKGIAFTKTSAITQWQWNFGDGSSSNTQNSSHNYAVTGTYNIKLVVTDINGCKDSVSKTISSNGAGIDFTYKQDVCNPLSVSFFSNGSVPANTVWSFGDGTGVTGNINPIHLYSTEGSYAVNYKFLNGTCIDSVSKVISLNIIKDNIVLTQDTTICFNTTKQLQTVPSFNFCWFPQTYLNDPLSPNPVTSTPVPITYYFTAEVPGVNLINNGDFTNGNTGFTSGYAFSSSNTTEGQYFIGSNPQNWNGSMSNCKDHTTGTGNMLMVNGSPAVDVKVWSQQVSIVPNTNYAFSAWLQSLFATNPARLSFAIDGVELGATLDASLPTCNWSRFFTTWNSGSKNNATISIINKNTQVQGNDFALDDISFSPLLIKRDSVKITIDTPNVRTIADTSACKNVPVALTTSGASQYTWTPNSGLSAANVSSPMATPATTTTYVVSGVNNFGCIAKDTVTISVKPLPIIIKSANDSICATQSIQLNASGGSLYTWSPAATLSNSSIANPIATPAATTVYNVTVTGNNGCLNKDSVTIKVNPLPTFSISPALSTCINGKANLMATGGDSYKWSPVSLLNNPAIANPVATVVSNTSFTVIINNSTCKISDTLFTIVKTDRLPPIITALKSNDIDCVFNSVQLNATGGNSYTWSPATSLSNSNIANPIARPVTLTQYTVTGIDTVYNCKSTDTISVFIKGATNPKAYIPNTFTPNGDGVNDCFRVRDYGTIKFVDIIIYNRYGNLVYASKNMADCWDGTYKGQPAEQGNYIYYIKSMNDCGEEITKGNLILLR